MKNWIIENANLIIKTVLLKWDPCGRAASRHAVVLTGNGSVSGRVEAVVQSGHVGRQDGLMGVEVELGYMMYSS